MSVANVIELSARSSESFDDAVAQGVARATTTLRNVTSAWVKEQQVRVEGNQVVEYQVTLQITFVLDDSTDGGD